MNLFSDYSWLKTKSNTRFAGLLLLMAATATTGCTDSSGRDLRKVNAQTKNSTAASSSGLYVQLVMPGTQLTSDGDMLTSLKTNCGSCHNSGNAPRVDLTTLPSGELAQDVERRINLNSDTRGSMPLGRPMSTGGINLMTSWLRNLANPVAVTTFAGYKATVLDTTSGASVPATISDDGRFSIDIGQQTAGTQVTLKITITDPSGEAQVFPVVTFAIDAHGQSYETLTLKPRDTTAPVTSSASIMGSNITETAIRVNWSPASDDRPSEALIYKLYLSTSPEFDTVAQVEANGTAIGDELSVGPVFAADVTALDPGKAYYFNVVVRDGAGNKSVYQKTQLVTRPQCAEISAHGTVKLWRESLAKDLFNGSKSPATVLGEISRCFPIEVPSALKRIEGYALKDNIAPASSGGTFSELPQKRPPVEILETPAEPNSARYWIPDNIEEIAKNKGWTAARYKSRHAGGFDQGTPNLLMVYVPGLTYDQWLNFPLPKDDDEPALGQPQYSRPKFGPPKREEYAVRGDLPSTFTMVTQDHPVDGKPGHVYFQMFFRTPGTSTFTPRGNKNLGGECVSCHPNGLRAISPLGYTVREGERALTPGDRQLTAEDLAAIKLINNKMVEAAGNMAPTWAEGNLNGQNLPLYRPEFRGPIYGASKPINPATRTPEFIKTCRNRNSTIDLHDIFGRGPGMVESAYIFKLSNAENPNINPQKVINAMNCESCHLSDRTSGASKRGPLDSKTDVTQIRFKVLVDQTMPLGAHANPNEDGNTSDHVVDQLTADERFALMNCLEAEFADSQTPANVIKWMTQESIGQ